MNPVLPYVTLKQLRAFVAVAETRSFTQASDELNITQSALSALVRQLESQVGFKLFDRTTRSVLLTTAGEEMFPVLQKIMRDLSSALSSTRELLTKTRGRVTIASSPLLSSTLVPELIRHFSDAYPGIDVALRDLPQDEVQQRVERGEADLGIGTYDDARPDVLAEAILVDRHMLVCPEDDALARTHPALAQIATLPLIVFPRGNATRQMLERGLAEIGVALVPRYEVSLLGTAIAMVRAGLGYAVVPAQAAGVFPRIALVPIKGLTARRRIHLMRHAYRSLSPAAEQFHSTALKYLPELGSEQTLRPL
ncbi:MAG: LysR substrate-binding domain-containing protein [Pigmentiphaga sp.]